ncbi:MAG: carbamate kinase [Chlamydiota bacterium]
MKKILVALGGNALLRSGEKGSAEEQLYHVQETADHFLDLIQSGYSLLITHGNGPQVGSILLANEMAKEKIPPMPLDICGAESQGMIGYMIQRTVYNRLIRANIQKPVVTIVTQTLVDKNDIAFSHPTKPIGLYYTKDEADRIKKEKGWTMVEQTGKGFRRVVPSPEPLDIVEGPLIKKLYEEGAIVIACGGGGIPVIREGDGTLTGVEAVIDKDHTAAVLGKVTKMDVLVILTDVEKVAIHFGKPNQENLSKLSLDQAKEYLRSGEFAKGSMGPKVEAACKFIQEGGKRAIITSLEKCKEALQGKSGTHFFA